MSIRLERLRVLALERRVLLRLAQEAVADGEAVEVRAHEAAEGVRRRTDDGLAAHVEAGVHDYRQPVLALKASSSA